MEEVPMLAVVEPARRAARVWERDEERPVGGATRAADDGVERSFAPEPLDSEGPEKQHDTRAHERELLLQPRCAERDLRRRGTAVARAARGLPREAFRDRGAVREVRLVDPRLAEPATQLRARAARERLAHHDLDRAGRLADDRDAIGRGSGDDRRRALEVSRVHALRARADARVKTREVAFANCHPADIMTAPHVHAEPRRLTSPTRTGRAVRRAGDGGRRIHKRRRASDTFG